MSRIGARYLFLLMLFVIGAGCRGQPGTADGLQNALSSTTQPGDGDSPATSQSSTTTPSDPPAPPQPPPPVPPDPSAKPDYVLLKNRQKFIGLTAYFQGVDRDAISFSIVRSPGHGQLLGSAPDLCYVPTDDFEGNDWFAYKATTSTQNFTRSVKLTVSADYEYPIGIPQAQFGIAESHQMYVGATYYVDGLGNPVGYQDAGNGPYTHYVDFNNGDDTGNPFGTAAQPRRTVPENLLPGSVVELHGTNINSQSRFTFSGQGTPTQPIFIRGASAMSKPVFRRPVSIQGNYIICENLEFDCQDLGPGTSGAIWFWVTNTDTAPFQVFHHVCLRHTLLHDQPMMDVGQNPAAIAVGVRNFDPALNDPTLRVHDVVAYDVEARNFGQWNSFTGNDDYYGCLLMANSDLCWVMDCHFHHMHGGGVGVSRAPAGSLQTPASNNYIGRNYFHQCKEVAVEYKHGVNCVMSQNLCHTFRKSDSSSGYAISLMDDDQTADWPGPDNIWLIFNTIYDSENGINHELRNWTSLAADKHSRSYMIGNLLFDIHYVRGNPALDGIAIHRGQLGESRIIGNTIYNCDQGMWLGFAGLTDTVHTTQIVRNNLIANLTERYLVLTGYDAMHIYLTPPSIDSVTTIESNQHFENAGHVHFTIVQPGMINGDYYTVADLQTATGFGANSVQADPLLISPSSADFRPSASGPAATGAISDVSYDLFKTTFGPSIDFYLDGTPRPASGGAIGALPPASN